jgi:alkylated DNA repair dioxygenase AlkB
MSRISSGAPGAGQQALFSPSPADVVDREPTGGEGITIDAGFGSAERIELDETSWIEHVPGWLTGDGELMHLLMTGADWEQRSRWMYDRRVQEPRLTAEYPVIAEAPHPILQQIADGLSDHYGIRYARLWMNWYRDNNDGTSWHADRPVDKLPEIVIPVLSLGATRKFLIKPNGGGRSVPIVTNGGDLVVMGGRCQKDYKHSVPKQRAATGPRLSLNFSPAQR